MAAAEPDGPDRAERPSERADARRNRMRILAAAEEVFAEHGQSGTTEDIADRAGVAVGTVFRHFPTKQALLQSIMKALLEDLRGEANRLAVEGDPDTAVFTFFTDLVGQAAARRTVIELLADAGTDIGVGVEGPIHALGEVLAPMLARAQRCHAIRGDVTAADLTALLISTTQGALRSGWTPEVQHRVLRIVFDGLATTTTRTWPTSGEGLG